MWEGRRSASGGRDGVRWLTEVCDLSVMDELSEVLWVLTEGMEEATKYSWRYTKSNYVWRGFT